MPPFFTTYKLWSHFSTADDLYVPIVTVTVFYKQASVELSHKQT